MLWNRHEILRDLLLRVMSALGDAIVNESGTGLCHRARLAAMAIDDAVGTLNATLADPEATEDAKDAAKIAVENLRIAAAADFANVIIQDAELSKIVEWLQTGQQPSLVAFPGD